LEDVKMQKSIFSIDKANISQIFLLDKLVSGQGLDQNQSVLILPNFHINAIFQVDFKKTKQLPSLILFVLVTRTS
jgi:hypothetical protein